MISLKCRSADQCLAKLGERAPTFSKSASFNVFETPWTSSFGQVVLLLFPSHSSISEAQVHLQNRNLMLLFIVTNLHHQHINICIAHKTIQHVHTLSSTFYHLPNQQGKMKHFLFSFCLFHQEHLLCASFQL